MVRGRETKILHSVDQRKGHANAHKQEPEQKEQCEAAQATMDLTLEAVYTAEGTWAHFKRMEHKKADLSFIHQTNMMDLVKDSNLNSEEKP